MNLNSKGNTPDVIVVHLYYHPHQWSDGASPDLYKFECVGKGLGSRKWGMEAVWVNRPAPATMRPRTMGILKAQINAVLSENPLVGGREVPLWESTMLSWADDK